MQGGTLLIIFPLDSSLGYWEYAIRFNSGGVFSLIQQQWNCLHSTQGTELKIFLLRSRCFQIDGSEGNQMTKQVTRNSDKACLYAQGHTAHVFQLPAFQRNTVSNLTQWTRSSSQLWLSLPLSLSLVDLLIAKLFTFFAYHVLMDKGQLRQT